MNLCSSSVTLRDSLKEAQAGDYIVISQSKSFSLLHVFQVLDHSIIMEEISAPLKLKSKIQGNWQAWISENAPGHTSWVMFELDLNNREIEDIYSFTQKSWKKVFAQEQIFPTLIDLEFNPIPEKRRKKVGPPLPSEMIDDRPLWNPPIIYEGKKLKGIHCEAYASYWPNDGTELAGKKIEIFLAEEANQIPSYFPIWLQVSDKISHAKLRLIDSGHGLASPHTSFPMSPLELKACGFTQEGHLRFKVRTHSLFEDYTLFLRQTDEPECIELPFELTQSSKREVEIVVSNEQLNNKMKLDKFYTFIFEPKHYTHLSVETPKSIKLPKQYATKLSK